MTMNTIITQKKLLCLDLGTETGWALQTRKDNIISGSANFQTQRFEGYGMRYLRFANWLDEINRTVAGGIELLFFEEVRRHIGTMAAHVYGGFSAALTAWCEKNKIPYGSVPVGTIKKFITGKGNAGKAEVIAAVKALGYQPADDNEADALALLRYVLQAPSITGVRA